MLQRVLQNVAACCSMLQRVLQSAHIKALRRVKTPGTLPVTACFAVYCSVLQRALQPVLQVVLQHVLQHLLSRCAVSDHKVFGAHTATHFACCSVWCS